MTYAYLNKERDYEDDYSVSKCNEIKDNSLTTIYKGESNVEITRNTLGCLTSIW